MRSIFKQPRRENLSPVIASVAKQSTTRATVTMDCFVATLLAMTLKRESAFSRRDAPELCMIHPPSEGVGNAGCPMHPQPRVRNVESTRVSHHRSTGFNPAFPHAMVLTVSFVLSPVIGRSCHRRLRKLPSQT